jgi:thioesterase domain-containing protein
VDVIFAEVAREFGRELPSASICYASSIRALAGLIEAPGLPAFSSFLKLRDGNDDAPAFILPGAGGRASFNNLAKHIDTNRSIYGIQSRGVDGREEPLERIEEMAEVYLRGVQEIQRTGPYFLIGYSFGGLVALEMARRVVASGGRVSLLALMDTFPDPRYLPVLERVRLLGKRMQGRVFGEKMPVEESDVGMRFGHSARFSFAATMQRVKESDFRALAVYRPRFYQGAIRFVKPATSPYLPSDPAAVWKKLVKEFSVETVPGGHVGMVGTHYKSLGAVLSRYLKESSAKAV